MTRLPTHVCWLADLLNGGRPAYVTLTYKQRRIVPGSNVALDRFIMRSQVKWLLLRLERQLFGRLAKKGRCLPRAVFHEGDGKFVRNHTHMVIELPAGMTADQLKGLIRELWPGSDWGRKLIDSRECYDYARAVAYSLKEGFDAFDEENSFFRDSSGKHSELSPKAEAHGQMDHK
jgi:hypothetical protein